MKKTLIAIAALAATAAFAQSSVQIDGIVDTGLVNYDMKGTKVTGFDRNLTSTSQINFRGTGDLGGGMAAYFRLENDMNLMSNAGNNGAAGNVAPTAAVAAGAATAAGSSTVYNGTASSWLNGEIKTGLRGGFGDVAFGALNNYNLDAAAGYSQPFGTAIGSGFRATNGNKVGAEVRNDNTFRYETPVIAGGLTVGWVVRKQQADATSTNYNASLGAQGQSGVSSLAARYNAGPLNVIALRSTDDATNVKTAAAGTGVTSNGTKGTFTAIAGNYNMGAATVYAGWQGQKATTGAGAAAGDAAGLQLGLKYVMGVNTFLAAVHRFTNTNVVTQASTSSTLTGLGYEYALAKNAAVTARYERIADTAGVAATTGYAVAASPTTDRTRMGVGIRYSF